MTKCGTLLERGGDCADDGLWLTIWFGTHVYPGDFFFDIILRTGVTGTVLYKDWPLNLNSQPFF